MCLIVHRDKVGAHIPNNVIDYNLKLNSDGFGIAWLDEGKLLFRKFAPNEAEQFRTCLKEVDKQPVEYVAHFRMGTHGPKTRDMAHPYVYLDEDVGDVLVFHNGVIPIRGTTEKSDTLHFVERVLTQMPNQWWNNAGLRWAIENSINGSRLAIMTHDGVIRLSGTGEKWMEQGGINYSTYPYAYYGPATTYHYVRDDDWRDDPRPKGTGVVSQSAESVGLFRPPVGTVKADAEIWLHNGHEVEPCDRVQLNSEGEDYGDAWCRECSTFGEYYIIGNEVYINVPHKVDDEDEYALLGAGVPSMD